MVALCHDVTRARNAAPYKLVEVTMIVRKVMLLAFAFLILATGGRIQAAPTILGILTTTYNPTNDPILNWRVTFDQPVTGVSASNFTLAGAGVSANISDVAPLPGNMSWRVTVDTIMGDGTLGLNLTDPNGISGTTEPLSSTATGQVYIIDNSSPYVVSITRLDPSPTLATSVDFQIKFSEPVYNVSSVNFAPGGTVAGTVSDISATTDPAVWKGTISGISGKGLLSLDLTDTSNITDAAGNWLLSDYGSGERYEFPPQLLCVRRLDPEITSATAVRYGVEFDVPVSGFTPANVAATGPGGALSDITVAPAGVSPSSQWIITVGSIVGDGTVQITLQNPSTVQENAGVSLQDFNALNCSELTYTIDQTPPTASCVQPAAPATTDQPTSASSVAFQVTFSEPVSGVSASNFQVVQTDLQSWTVGNPVSSDGITWLIPVTGISENAATPANGTISLAWLNTTGIVGVAGNGVAVPTGCAAVVYTIDQRQPSVDCISREPANAPELTSSTVLTFRVRFDETISSATVDANDFSFTFLPAAAVTSSTILGVEAVAPIDSSQLAVEDYLVTATVALGPTTPPFVYNNGDSIGNGYASVTLAPGATILDVAGNPISQPVALANDCGATSWTVDTVPPRVKAISFLNNDCLTSAIFTISFSEAVTPPALSDLQLSWTGGNCDTTVSLSRITATGPLTYDVEATGTFAQFHQNGPGKIQLSVNPGAIRDIAENPMVDRAESSVYEICRCFEPAVVTIPRVITTNLQKYPDLAPGFADCASPDVCTSVGLLRPPFNDTPTTLTTADFIHWNATEWDCQTSTPFTVYLDDVMVTSTAGGRDLNATTQTLPNTPNPVCNPIGQDFRTSMPTPLAPGLHQLMINEHGACTSGTIYYFNVLDAPRTVFPSNNFASCKAVRAFEWTAVDGAVGYDIFLKKPADTCYELVERVTSPTTYLDASAMNLSAGIYTWYVQAYNEYGHQASKLSTFRVQGADIANPVVLSTDGTIYDVYATTTTTFIAGDFSRVKVGASLIPASNFAAISNSTREILKDYVPQPNGPVYCIEANGTDLYLGGKFTAVDGTPRGRIARFKQVTSGTETIYGLDNVFMPGADDTVRDIAVTGTLVLYAGDFTRVGTQVYNFGNMADQVPAVRIAATGTTVTAGQKPVPVNLNPNASVNKLIFSGDDVYIGGSFSQIGNKPIHALARARITLADYQVDPGFDLNIGADVNHYVYTMAKRQNSIFIGGQFTTVQSQPRMNAARLDLSSTGSATLAPWNPQPTGAINSIALDNDTVFVGGTFTTLRQERNTYLGQVDPVLGYPLSCSMNCDRLVYDVEITPQTGQTGGPVLLIQVGGLATTKGP